MKAAAPSAGDVTAKLIACVLVIGFLVIGAVGLILPIIPGLLFLAIAAIVAARHLPSLDRMLRRNRTMGGYLDSADRFSDLELSQKIRYGCLLCLKMLIDGVAFAVSAAMKLVRFAVTADRSRRR